MFLHGGCLVLIYAFTLLLIRFACCVFVFSLVGFWCLGCFCGSVFALFNLLVFVCFVYCGSLVFVYMYCVLVACLFDLCSGFVVCLFSWFCCLFFVLFVMLVLSGCLWLWLVVIVFGGRVVGFVLFGVLACLRSAGFVVIVVWFRVVFCYFTWFFCFVWC